MDCSYQNLGGDALEIEHDYGPKVHLLRSPVMNTVLARLGSPKSFQPHLNRYVDIAYQYLLGQALSVCCETRVEKIETRMSALTEHGNYHGEVLEPSSSFVVVDLARAGTFPSHLIFDQLHDLFKAENLRQDHFYLNRKVNEQDQVIGVDVSGSKIGGGQDNSYVLFPDPMGATGGSLSHCVSHYKNEVAGRAKRYLALHIIITPEYIARMQQDHPDVEIFALRLDRGLSSKDVLAAKPGSRQNEERGLTDTQYIVPGAGGVGEILNNSFV